MRARGTEEQQKAADMRINITLRVIYALSPSAGSDSPFPRGVSPAAGSD